MSEWQPIETAPKYGTIIDLWAESHLKTKGRRFPDCSWDSYTERWRDLPYDYKEWKPTHWMARPDPPSALPAGSVHNDPNTGIAAAIVKGKGKEDG